MQIQCPREGQISSLKLKNCYFGGKLKSSWLQLIEISIITLIFEDCPLNSIEQNAFSSLAFQETKHLEIINASVGKLQKGIFRNLNNLVSLTIRDNLIQEAEFNLLENIADTLEIIELDRSIWDEKVVNNITNASQLLKVELLSMQGNNISFLSSDIFRDFPNLLSIYLDSSQIKNIHVDAFQSLTSIKQIFLSHNALTTLEENIFNTIILKNPNVRIMLNDNPWNCNCTFEWIQKMIYEKPNLLGIIPKCNTPEINSGLTFLQANFCSENLESTSVAASVSQSSIVEKISCEENVLLKSLKNNQLPRRIDGFYIKQYYDNGSVLINVKSSSNPQAIIWFRVNAYNSSISNITCLTNVNRSVILQQLKKNSAYTVCLLDIRQGLSPLNCLPLITRLQHHEPIIWLEKDDKPVAIIIVLSITGLFFIAGGVVSFFIILNNPHLIRASSRVIMVKRGQVDAMILPKGVLSPNPLNNNNLKPEYLTPIGTTKNLIFQGNNYYDSIKKLPNQGNNLIKTCQIPPPLPPYPKTLS